MANRGKMRQIADVKRSKIVVEIGVFYYPLPCVTLGDLECRWFEFGRQTIFSTKHLIILSQKATDPLSGHEGSVALLMILSCLNEPE